MGVFVGGGSGGRGAAVTGMPYSAQEVTEHVQTLADGTRITQPSQQVTYYRDSQGRTRTERTIPLPPGMASQANAAPAFIDIFDAVSGARYTLDPRSKTARKVEIPPPSPPPPPGTTAVRAANGRAVSAAIVPSGDPVAAQRQRPETTHESLGIQSIEGVTAQGTRTTYVYPVGFFGNDRPITVVDETWMCQDLKRVVLSKTSDPRSGESTTRLTNISRAEPDPALFQVPPDYEIK